VRVSGLEAGTTYRFQTLTIAILDGLPLFAPAYPQLMEVTTESATVVVDNDPIRQMIYDENGDPAIGALLVASVEGGDYPVTAWVGDGVASPWARADLNQLYSAITHENLQLLGGEELTLWSFGGYLGNYVNIQKVQTPTGGNHTALPESAHLNIEKGYYVALKLDLNIVAVQSYSTPAMTAHELLLYLKEQAGGDPLAVENIKLYNKQTGSWETASWFDDKPAGPDFPIEGDQAYLVYMRQDLSDVWLEGIACGATIDLTPGLNLVSLPAANGSVQYSSYDMIQSIGDYSWVASVQRYDSISGWQTTSWFSTAPSGVEFDTYPGEGYVIYMNEQRESWRPY